MGEIVARFFLGGAIVSVFALFGEVFKPKTFAGIFGAAPSVAIATLSLAIATKGAAYVRLEAFTMLAGCVALLVYTQACVLVVQRRSIPVWAGASISYVLWLAVALTGWLSLRTVGVLG